MKALGVRCGHWPRISAGHKLEHCCLQSTFSWRPPDCGCGAQNRPVYQRPLSADMANLSLHDHDGSSGASDQDTLAPLPHPGAAPWPMAFPYQYPPPPHPYNPHPGFPELGYSYGGGSASSQHSEGKSETLLKGSARSPGHLCTSILCLLFPYRQSEQWFQPKWQRPAQGEGPKSWGLQVRW